MAHQRLSSQLLEEALRCDYTELYSYVLWQYESCSHPEDDIIFIIKLPELHHKYTSDRAYIQKLSNLKIK